MIDKETAESFVFKVDSEGLSYAVENYAPDTDDKEFEDLKNNLQNAIDKMEAYIETLREEYGIEVF